VRDVCRAYRLLLDPGVPAGIYNVASGVATPLRRVVETLVGLVSVPVTVRVDPARVRPTDTPIVCGDPARLRAATGWEPRIELGQTLADTLDAARAAVTTGRMSAT
jgi:GDP-4-dehydro-6-deoxy-D-mannose reductase